MKGMVDLYFVNSLKRGVSRFEKKEGNGRDLHLQERGRGSDAGYKEHLENIN